MERRLERSGLCYAGIPYHGHRDERQGDETDFKWRHFEGAIILWAVRWYCRYGISYRKLQKC